MSENLNKEIAVVILNWNGSALLEQFLPSVLQYSEEAKIYVADNASTDNSIEILKTKFPEVTIISNQENGGYAKGYNDALIKVHEPILCLLNSDVEVTQDWLKPVKQCLIDHPEVAIVQPKILDYKKKDYFEYAGAAGGYIDRLGYPFCRGRIFETLEEDKGQYNDTKPIFWASGACFFIKNEVFKELKGFDEDYFAHQEEIDLCWRAQNRNFKVLYVGQSTVYHVGGATLDSMNPQKTFLNFRNSLFSITKNLPKRKFIPIVLARLILDGLAGLNYLFQLKFKHFLAIIRAHFSYYYYFATTFKKRSVLNRDYKYFECNSIVFNYFVLKNNYFSEVVKSGRKK